MNKEVAQPEYEVTSIQHSNLQLCESIPSNKIIILVQELLKCFETDLEIREEKK